MIQNLISVYQKECESLQKFSERANVNNFSYNFSKKLNKLRKSQEIAKTIYKRFGNKYVLETHIKIVHEYIKAFKCESCEKYFGQKSKLDRHLKSVHENLRNHKCESCGKMFSQKVNLGRHLKTFHEHRYL